MFLIEPLSSEHQHNKYWKSCFGAVFLMSKQRRRSYVDSNFIFNPISTLKKHRVIDMEPKWIYFQRWNNVDKHTSAQLSFSTKFQRWNNIGSSTLNRRNSINAVSTSFCQRWNNVDKCTSDQLSFSTKYQSWNNADERWRSKFFQRWYNVDVFVGK